MLFTTEITSTSGFKIIVLEVFISTYITETCGTCHFMLRCGVGMLTECVAPHVIADTLSLMLVCQWQEPGGI